MRQALINENKDLYSQNDKYIVLENQDKEKNVFTEDEFNKLFKKLIIEDIKHCDKFEKLNLYLDYLLCLENAFSRFDYHHQNK